MTQPTVTSRRGSVREALRRLDPTSRALLDLSYRHRWRPEEIAKVLGIDRAAVVEMRDAALVRVAADVGLTGDGELGRATELLAGRASNGAAPVPDRRRRSPAGTLAAAGVVGVALAIALPLALGGASKHTPHRTATVTRQAAGPASVPRPAAGAPAQTAPPSPPLALRRLAGTPLGARATARLVPGSRRLELAVSGLPLRGPRSFAVWLLGRRGGHVTLARFAGGAKRLTVGLPPDYRRYASVEVVRIRRRYPPRRKPVLALAITRLPGA